MSKSAEDVLKEYWGYPHFRGNQRAVITSAMEGNDTLALMPTGSGKSLCYQVPALAQDGLCLVISPLIALIEDQVGTLKGRGIKALGLTGRVPYYELDVLLDNAIHGNYKFLYLSPERLQQTLVQERIRSMNVNLIAIDEAHCISEWGHDFRPHYRNCAMLRGLQPSTPFMALTATATKRVADDIVTNLKLKTPTILRSSFARKNLVFEVIRSEDKWGALQRMLRKTSGSSIIYVRSRKETEQISKKLWANTISSTFFHGGISTTDKKQKLQTWLNDETRVMVATNAFGMGIDKADVALVVHYQLPDSIENYYQEAGRAGRNGATAKAVLLFNESDIEKAKWQYLDNLPDYPFIKKVYSHLNTFFQVAYGAGQNNSFNLSLGKFCERYALGITKTFSALKLLDQQGIISLTTNAFETTTILLTGKKSGLAQWMEKSKNRTVIVQTLLRTYGGLFEYPVKINLELLVKKTQLPPATVHRIFEQMNNDGLCEFERAQEDTQVVFLHPREDDRTLNTIRRQLKSFRQMKVEKLRFMMAYAQNVKKCRVGMILDYFGEKSSQPCGKCDVCTAKFELIDGLDSIKQVVLHQLQNADKSSKELADELDYKEKILIDAIKELLEEKKLKLKTGNTYGLNI